MPIGIYSAERCIVDAFRFLAGDVGYELGRDALREWLRRGGKPAQLMEDRAGFRRELGNRCCECWRYSNEHRR